MRVMETRAGGHIRRPQALTVPTHVDPDTGYRWYAATQLDQARLVTSLRRIRVPLTRIRDILALDATSAAEEIRACWAVSRVVQHRCFWRAVLHPAERHRGPSNAARSLLKSSTPRDPAQLAAFINLRVLSPEHEHWRRGVGPPASTPSNTAT
jgi:DNA-binding transcriptional MerR regulator